MGVHFNNVFALARAIHQIVMHRHIDFTDHLKRCRKQQIGRTRHDTLGTVFHWNNRKVSGAAGGLMKHFVETSAGKRLETRAELPNHGFLGERSLRPEKGHARQSLDGHGHADTISRTMLRIASSLKSVPSALARATVRSKISRSRSGL